VIKFTVKDEAITFAVRVQPRASQNAVVGELDGALKVRLAAPPVAGAANEELVRYLAKLFAVPRQQVTIISGATARHKLVRLSGLTASEFEQTLRAVMDEA
jgi:hypothetical protein